MAEASVKTLRDVPIGQTATVRRLAGEGALKRHIMDMGITKGVRLGRLTGPTDPQGSSLACERGGARFFEVRLVIVNL